MIFLSYIDIDIIRDNILVSLREQKDLELKIQVSQSSRSAILSTAYYNELLQEGLTIRVPYQKIKELCEDVHVSVKYEKGSI